MKNQVALIAVSVIAMTAMPTILPAQSPSGVTDNRGFATIQEILVRSCSACHDWTGSYESITGNGHIVPGNPDKSYLYQRIARDEMPASGPKLTPEEKAFIRGWIIAGAPNTDSPIAVPAPEAGATATAGSLPAASEPFLLFPSKTTFHVVTGFTSTALLFGAGIIGVIHFLDMMREGHILRDAIGFTEGSPESLRIPLVQQAWESDAQMGWLHVGLIISGETLYLGDAITGLSMLTEPQPGKLTKHDIHRIAFFTHATLMTAQIVLGFLTTDALSRGDHAAVVGLGAAHATIGLSIPLVMLAAGLENLLLPE